MMELDEDAGIRRAERVGCLSFVGREASPVVRDVPPNIPTFAIRYWQAVERWYHDASMLREPTMDELVEKFDPAIGVRTLARYFNAPGERYARVRPFLGAWPPQRGDRPPWQHVIMVDPSDDSSLFNVPGEIHRLERVLQPGLKDGKAVTIVSLFDSITGELVRQYIERSASMIATSVAALLMLDVWTDGRLDLIIRIGRAIKGLCHLGLPL